jgi:hypothetical protein
VTDRILPDPYERERALVEVRGMDAESASAAIDGGGVRSGEFEAHHEHCGSGWWWESVVEGAYNVAGSQAAYPGNLPKQFRYRLGWWRAGSGAPRDYRLGSEEAEKGWDEFRERYPSMARNSDPWGRDG